MQISDANEIIYNHRIHYKYVIIKKIDAGIALLGWEIKSIRSKLIAIDNSYVSFQGYEAFMYNAIFQNQFKNNESSYNPSRVRKLLLKKKELLFLKDQIYQNRYTIVVLKLFWKKNWIKVNIGIAKGKKKYDKRQTIHINSWKKEKNQYSKIF